ncbi:MAG TPA: hypothetical protein VGM44_05115 [Polyangiaceae bacterium]
MNTLASAPVSRADLPALLVTAVASGEPELALRSALAPLEFPAELCARFVARALSIHARAARQNPPASRVELELALGAALVLAGVGASHSNAANS